METVLPNRLWYSNGAFDILNIAPEANSHTRARSISGIPYLYIAFVYETEVNVNHIYLGVEKPYRAQVVSSAVRCINGPLPFSANSLCQMPITRRCRAIYFGEKCSGHLSFSAYRIRSGAREAPDNTHLVILCVVHTARRKQTLTDLPTADDNGVIQIIFYNTYYVSPDNYRISFVGGN